MNFATATKSLQQLGEQEELAEIVKKFLPPFYKKVAEKLGGELSVNIEFHKAKFVNNLYMEVEWTEQVLIDEEPTGSVTNKKNINFLPTQDLRDCFLFLANHALQISSDQDVEIFHEMQAAIIEGWEVPDLTGYNETRKPTIKDRNMLNKTKVVGVSWGGSETSRGVSFSCQRNARNGKKMNINTPFTKLLDEENPYPFEAELQAAISELERELILYIYVGKIDAELLIPQTKIDFDAN